MAPCHPRCEPRCPHGVRARETAGIINEQTPPSYDQLFYGYSRWSRPTPPSTRPSSPKLIREISQTVGTGVYTSKDASSSLQENVPAEPEKSTMPEDNADVEPSRRKEKKDRKIAHSFYKRLSALGGHVTRVFHRKDPAPPPEQPTPPSQSRSSSPSLRESPSRPLEHISPINSTSGLKVEWTDGSPKWVSSGLEASTDAEPLNDCRRKPLPEYETETESDDVSSPFFILFLDFLFRVSIWAICALTSGLFQMLENLQQQQKPAKNPGTSL